MKNLLLSFFVLLLTVAAVSAQGKSELKAASKAFDAYKLSQDLDQLNDAATNIAVAMTGAETMSDPKTFVEAGDIYAAIMNQMVIIKTSGIGTLEDLPKIDNPAAMAADAYMKAFSLAEKKGDQKAALTGLTDLQGNLSNAGIFGIQDKEYSTAYTNFSKSAAVHDFLLANGGESSLTAENKINDELFYAAVTAQLADKLDAATPLFEKLRTEGYDDSGVYDGLYKIYAAKGDKEKALMLLNEGREKYPDDAQLLFTEINYYLAEKKLDVLTGKLAAAIEKEPDNVSLYATTGSVYDNLYQSAAAAGEEDKAAEYFQQAKSFYEQALEKKPDYVSAVYSIGALYFNRAAAMTQELIALNDDLSREGQKKYEALSKKIDEEFAAALPYFKQAEQMDPTDMNTLIALREIYARNDELEVSNEFKRRIDVVTEGGTLESYFKN